MKPKPRLASGRIVVDGGALAGTAWRIRPGLALSAAHCLRKPLSREYHMQCEVEFPEFDRRITATVNPGDLDPELDVVLLQLHDDAATAPCLKLARMPWDDIEDRSVSWSGFGYPDAEPFGLALTGEIDSVHEHWGRGIQLSCRQGGSGYLLHASGSAVLHDGYAIALIAWGPEALAHRVIFARPIDQVARRFKLQSVAHPRFGITAPAGRRYLACDRDDQWRHFQSCLQPRSLQLFFVRGHEHEAPEHFVEGVLTGRRLERTAVAASPEWQVREVRWPDVPAATPADFLAALSRAVFGDEVPPTELAEILVEMSRQAPLAVIHRMLNISSPLVQDRFDEIYTYYATTLPDLLRFRLPLPRDSKGIVFVQPYYWDHGLGSLSSHASAADLWEDRLRAMRPDPLQAVMAPELTQITVDHVDNFLKRERPDLTPAERDKYLKEAQRRTTSRQILKFLQEEIR
jgi:hypothetical protein